MIEKVNLKERSDAVSELFMYHKVGQINDHMLSVLQAENRVLDFHEHDNSDEMFYCIEGEFDIEFLDGFLLYCIWVMVFRILPYLLRVLNAVAAASQPWNTENPRRGTPKIARFPPDYLTSRFPVLK